MNTDIEASTRVYTTTDGRAVVEQADGNAVVLAAEQILTVIAQLHACYDYCAAWKAPLPEQDETTSEAQR